MDAQNPHSLVSPAARNAPPTAWSLMRLCFDHVRLRSLLRPSVAPGMNRINRCFPVELLMNDPVFPTRKSPRLPGYDYAQASAYLVTISVDQMEHRFGEVVSGAMRTNQTGELVEATWLHMPERFPSIELNAFVVMPNHFHGIVFVGTDPESNPPTLSRIIQVFKSEAAVEYGRGIREGRFPPVRRALWHRSFHDRILWDGRILGLAREYVADNPRKWQETQNTRHGS